MNQKLVDSVVNAVLYEGHILYPYRASAKKNRQQSAFGRVFPEPYAESGAEPCSMQAECLVDGGDETALEITVRFLHAMERDIGALAAPLREMPAADNPDFFHVVPELEVDGRLYLGWQEMVERSVQVPATTLRALREKSRTIPFSFPVFHAVEPILDRTDHIAGVVVRRQEAITGVIEAAAERIDDRVTKVTLRVVNRTPVPSEALDDSDEIVMRTFASTHAIFHARGAAFLSLIDPPETHATVAGSCRNLGVWPVLVGEKENGERDTMVASPVILHDFPTIAQEDATRAGDEIVRRILTVSGEERREMRRSAASKSPGTKRQQTPRVDTVSIQGIVHKTGDLVRVRPRNQADALALAGRIAMIESIAQEAGEKTQLALVLENESPADTGSSHQVSRRFVYTTDEVEPLEGE
jgi:hydrogenase maturation protease